MSVTDVMAAALRADVTSRSAASVLADPRNADLLPATPTLADIPPHTTTCLLEIFNETDPAWLNEHVSAKYGEMSTEADAGIELSMAASDSEIVNYGDRSDEIGVKTAAVKILCRIGQVALDGSDTRLIETAVARIEYILDWLTRGQFKGGSNLLPALDPRSIDPALCSKYGVKVQFMQDLAEQTATESLTLWRVQYKLLHLH
jgi:hypothetical protein